MSSALLTFLSHAGVRAALAAAAFAVGIASAYAEPSDDLITVNIDRAKVIQLPERTATVIVGNPIIADVTMLKRSNRMVLTGKGFGETNLIALDSSGNAIGESV